MKDFEIRSILPTIAFSRYQIPKATYGFQWMEVYGALVASLSFLCSGAVQSYTSPFIYGLEGDGESNITLTRSDILWIASSPSLAAFVGTSLAAPLLEFCGRQKSLIVSGNTFTNWMVIILLNFILSFYLRLGKYFRFLIGFASNIGMIHAGRAFTGLSIGISKAAAPVYVSEISTPSSRGFLGFLCPLMNAAGILLGLWVGCWIHWRTLAILISTFPILLLLLSLWIPESPTWLLMKKQGEAAFKSLERLRGYGHKMRAQEELEEMRSTIEDKHTGSLRSLNWKDIILRKENYLGFSLMIFQQFSGVSAVIFYFSMIVAEVGTNGTRLPRSLEPKTAGFTVGVVHFVAFFISLPLIDRLGRRILLIVSGSLMAVSHAMLALFLYMHLNPNGVFVHETCSWLPITCLGTFIAAFSIGFGPVPFVFMTEVFSNIHRGYLSSMATLIAQIASFCVLQLFPVLLKMTSAYVVFLLYAFICFLSVIFVYLLIPETKGKSLAEIEKYFRTPPTLLEEKEAHHMALNRVEVPFVFMPIARPPPPLLSQSIVLQPLTTPTTIHCKSPAVL